MSGDISKLDWLAQPLKYLQEDPMNAGYYYITINTSEAGGIGNKVITIEASLDNFTAQTLYVYLEILPRPTSLNGDASDLLYISK